MPALLAKSPSVPTGPYLDSELSVPPIDGVADLLVAHRELVARFGLGVAPALSFRQVLARVIERNDRENRKVEATLADSRSPLP